MSDDILVSTRERPGQYDGLESAKPGEILFVVQGLDPFGPDTVLHWVGLARAAGMTEANEDRARRLLRKAGAAEEVAWAMRAAQRGEASAEAEKRPVDDAGESGASDHAVIAARAADRLHNSIAEIDGVLDRLAAADIHPDARTALQLAIERLRAAAAIIEPRRHMRGQERKGESQ